MSKSIVKTDNESMNDLTAKQKTTRWLQGWKVAGEYLERESREALKSVDTMKSLQALSSAFESARFLYKPRENSGLVQFQAYLGSARRDRH